MHFFTLGKVFSKTNKIREITILYPKRLEAIITENNSVKIRLSGPALYDNHCLRIYWCYYNWEKRGEGQYWMLDISNPEGIWELYFEQYRKVVWKFKVCNYKSSLIGFTLYKVSFFPGVQFWKLLPALSPRNFFTAVFTTSNKYLVDWVGDSYFI